MRLARELAVILLLTAPCAGAGDIFVWRDHTGVSHYTTDLTNVPEEFRGEAVTVAKEWKRAEPPPEAIPASVAVPADAATAVPAHDLYEAAYLAGVRAGQLERQGGSSGDTTNMVQSLQVQPQQSGVSSERLVPVPVIVDRRPRARSERDHDREDGTTRDDFPPARRAPFLQGPAGPPPISDR
jgi:hypothetical protein